MVQAHYCPFERGVEKQNCPEDARLITEWHIREFLAYTASEGDRWGLKGNSSETSPIEGFLCHCPPLFRRSVLLL